MGFPFCICNLTLLLFVLGLFTAVITASPYPVITSLAKFDPASVSDKIKTLAFKVPCVNCLASGDDAVLEFEVQLPRVSSTTDICTVPLALNGVPLIFDHDHSGVYSILQTSASDWTVDLTVQGFCDTTDPNLDSPRRILFFDVDQVDNNPIEENFGFTIVLDSLDQAQALVSSNTVDNQTNCASALESVVDETSSLFTLLDTIPKEDDSLPTDDFDLQERELRQRLYDQATALHKLNEECRKSTQSKLADCHHDFSCIAKVMCQRIHDTTMSRIKEIQASLHDSVMVSKQRHDQYVVAADEKDDWDFNATDIDSLIATSKSEKSKSDKDTQNPVILALEILAAVLGLGALYKLIRLRFCSLRRRVERLADREERKRARHFRSLARREALRKKWASFRGVFKRQPRRNGDYEEKRALILEAAGEVADDYVTEDGQVDVNGIERTLGDLHRVHGFVTEMVDGPTATTQHPQRSRRFGTRARGGSLPSYTEEKLPDYTSNPDDDDGDVVEVANGFRYAASSGGGSVANTAVTPDSSIVLTPRCSRETLRTGTSRDGSEL